MIRFSFKGLPAKVEAGGGWYPFTLNVTDTTSTAVGAVEATVTVSNGEASENGDLFEHAYLEFWDAGRGTWLSLKDEGKDEYRETGIIYGYTDLQAHESAGLRFRLRVDAKATPGNSYAVGGGTYVDPEKHCTDGTTTDASFEVLAPGESGGGSGPGGTPAPSATAGGSPGGTPAAPATGTLAETGSSGAVPVLAAAGGAAVLGGAGAMVLVRRRRSGTGAA
ncbi:LPXTG cell wall anchor domain-containing protein [Streptomyces sp. NBC_01476]|uniref:LPXTG cell wall anchor domain-containing protein n=1 Tax=Streptomyces sp. NBC_01476 TaxID=2903881 RepID=UPI002E338C98|nr:LPXTG cell wall anchor domain-containing protein [Streptomyces sp. NBC_01476]